MKPQIALEGVLVRIGNPLLLPPTLSTMHLRRRSPCFVAMLFLSVCLPALASRPRIAGTAANRVADEVLHTLLSTPLGQATPPLPWQVTQVEEPYVNAFSNGTGNLTVTRGLGQLLGDDRGLWAAVLSHEIGHHVILYRANLPRFQAALDSACLQAHLSQESGSSHRTLFIAPAAGGLLNPKHSRENEYEADRVGVMLMAEAGYHPDYATALDRLMAATMGDKSKSVEFLLNHPRWASREQHMMVVYNMALAIFQSRCPGPGDCPEGDPPPLGTIEGVTARQDARDQSLVLRVPVSFRNASGFQVRVAAIFLGKNRRVRGAQPEYTAPDGSLALNAPLPPSPAGSTEAVLRLPLAAMSGEHRKLKAVVFLVAGERRLDVYFKPVNLSHRKR